jgi:hypothetical protein
MGHQPLKIFLDVVGGGKPPPKGRAPFRFTQKMFLIRALLEMIGGWIGVTAEDSLHVLWDYAVAFLFSRSLDRGRQPLCAKMAEFCSRRK